jgi:hypothetical protein
MQDTKNLNKKIQIHYPKLIREAMDNGDDYTANFWKRELEMVKDRIALRNRNKQKNLKQFKKAN